MLYLNFADITAEGKKCKELWLLLQTLLYFLFLKIQHSHIEYLKGNEITDFYMICIYLTCEIMRTQTLKQRLLSQLAHIDASCSIRTTTWVNQTCIFSKLAKFSCPSRCTKALDITNTQTTTEQPLRKHKIKI